MSKAAVSGLDGRVRSVRYILYKSTGEYVKERVVLKYESGKPAWPLPVVRDTLPKGSYKAVFLGNVEKSFFPYGSPATTQDVLLNYRTAYSAARIALPPARFTDSTEYYWANVPFSDASPNPSVLLQRVIGMVNVHRNFIDAQTALNKLTANIVAQVDYKNFIRTAVNAALPGLLKPVLDKGTVLGNAVYNVVGGLDALVGSLSAVLVQPVTDTLYARFLRQVVNQVGVVLTGNSDQSGMLAAVGVLLNPWALSEARTAIVTIDNFPKTMDLDLAVQDKYPVGTRFRFDFNSTGVYAEKDILIRGLNGLFDIRKIDVIKQGLVAGLVVDQALDNFVLDAAFIDIHDPLQVNVPSNKRFKSNYSFLDLKLNSYTPAQDNAHRMTLSVRLGEIGNLNGTLLGGIPLISTILSGVIGSISNVTVSVPVYLPFLNVENLTLTGGWDTPTAY